MVKKQLHVISPIIVTLLIIACKVVGQTASPQVISTFGTHSSTNETSIRWTIGEPVILTTAGGDIILTQGFQQPFEVGFTNIDLNLTAYLEGAYDDTGMTSILNAKEMIPLTQPYNTPPWNYSGSETVTEIPSGVTDWVLIELRDAANATLATPSSMIARQAGFLMKDGTVKGTNGTTNLIFEAPVIQHIFAIVWHRNHLGVMSAYPIIGSGGLYSYDYSTDESQVYGGASGHTYIDPENQVYSLTTAINSGTLQFYKFINGNDWGGVENVSESCGWEDGSGGFNRMIVIPEKDTVLDLVCFSSCYPCNAASTPVNVTFQVDMTDLTISPNGVHIAGDFQDWNPSTTELLPIGNNIFAVTLNLPSGSLETYKFINGNSWGNEESVPYECSSQDDYNNRLIVIPPKDISLTPVCFGSCNSCGTAPHSVNVTFRVDMCGQTISPNGVHMAGSFQGWNPSVNELIPGVWGMISGEGISDGIVDPIDKTNVWILEAGQEGYKYGDFNLDGQVNNQDKDDHWLINQTKQCQVPDGNTD